MRRRRTVAQFIAAASLAASVGAVGVVGLNIDAAAAFAADNSGVTTGRIAGNTAADTAATAARAAFPGGANSAVISVATDYRDGLAASGLAGTLDAPMLVTGTDSLDWATREVISQLGVKNVYIVGGTPVVSENVENELKTMGLSVERIAGGSASDTSLACANKIAELGGNPRGECIVVDETGFADAASISSYAYKYQVPLIFESGSDYSSYDLPAGAVALGDAANRILVVGSDGVVPTRIVEDRSAVWAAKTLRMAGASAYDTSKVVAETLVAEGSLEQDVVGVTTGEGSSSGVDTIAAAALCAKHDAPLILTDNSGTATTVNNFLVEQQDNTQAAYVFGSSNVIPDDTYNYIRKVVDGSFRYTAIIGSDQWQPAGYAFHLEGSDLQMLLASDAETGKVWLVSIPRDTYYDTGRGKYKSNYAYHFAFYDAQAQGYSTKESQNIAARATADMMSELFGVSVSHYAITNLNDYMTLIDRIGGLHVDVPYTIDYDFYAMHNLETGANQSPFNPIHFEGGWYNFDGLMTSSLARARTSNLGGTDYASYGLNQDAIRQAVNRMQMISLVERVFQAPSALNFVEPLVNAGLIDTDYTGSQLADVLGSFAQRGNFTIYASTTPVNGDIVQLPDDAPWLVPYDQQFFVNIRNNIMHDEDTSWLNNYYNTKIDSWFPLAWSWNISTNTRQAGTFNDVFPDDWYYECIELAASLGYVNGYDNGYFGPNDTLTRGQAACILANMDNADNSVAYNNEFTDVDGSEFFGNNVAWAKKFGVMNGYNGTTLFGPWDQLTREQVACTLYNYAKEIYNQDVTVADIDGALAAFPDGDDVDGWAREAVAWAVTNHIMGNGGFINPTGAITRAEMAAMTTNFQPEALQ